MILEPLSFEAGLYAATPKFVSGPQPKATTSITREFVYEGYKFVVTIFPHVVANTSSKYASYFPGKDEALIESVLLELSSKKVSGGRVVSLPVSDVIAVLEGYGLVINRNDFFKSLDIMSGSKLKIEGVIKDKKLCIISSMVIFSVYNDLYVNIKLNPMLDNSLLGGRFRARQKKEKSS